MRYYNKMKQQKFGFGWVPDIPSEEDYTAEIAAEKGLLPKGLMNMIKARKSGTGLNRSADLRKWSSGVEQQEELGSCTANGALSLLELMEKKAFDKHTDLGRLFTYWVTRYMMGEQYVPVDSGAYNRTTIKSIVKVGVIPESMWPYATKTFANPPTVDMFLNTTPHRALAYLRLDSTYGESYVVRMKKFLMSDYALFTGFAVYDNIWNVTKENPVLQYPVRGNKLIGGHAVMCVGYSDDINTNVGQGAFLMQNSWGKEWGDNGFYWMPYRFFERGVATDTWAISSLEFVESKKFD